MGRCTVFRFMHFVHEEGYVLDRWEVAYAPSAAVWRFCRLRPEPKGREDRLYSAISDPDIAHVHEEVAALVGQLLRNADVYEDDDRATLNNVPTGRAPIATFTSPLTRISARTIRFFSGLKTVRWMADRTRSLPAVRFECSSRNTVGLPNRNERRRSGRRTAGACARFLEFRCARGHGQPLGGP